MKTLSLDLRERILASYDDLEGTRQEIADRYRFSLGMVKRSESFCRNASVPVRSLHATGALDVSPSFSRPMRVKCELC
jgi:hypothetical protein